MGVETESDKPLDGDIDVCGMTNAGLVRDHNEDQFLICSLHRTTKVHATSLPALDNSVLTGERLGFLALVADGVGGELAGEVASQLTVETLTSIVATSAECFFSRDPGREPEFVAKLEATVHAAHERVLAEAAEGEGKKGMSTTLTMVITSWPVAYVVQVGDSRFYQLRGGELRRITRDQTVAQDLVDAGVDESQTKPWSHVLSSAVGGAELEPAISRIDMERGDIFLGCTDGLTDLVSDERIRDHLMAFETAERTCKALIKEALDAGGHDNVTVIVASPRPRPSGRPPL